MAQEQTDYGSFVEVDGLRGVVRPLELEPAAAAASVIDLQRVDVNLYRVTLADDSVVSVDAATLKTLPQGGAQLGTLLAREQAAARKRKRTEQ